jgi:hypothetical protein
MRLEFWRWTLVLFFACALRPPQAWNLAPKLLGDALAAAGPAVVLFPLWAAYLRGALRARHASLHRAVLLSLCAWLLVIAPIRCAKRALLVLLGVRGDPSGHIFLFGVQLVPLWVAQREDGGSGGSGGGGARLAWRAAEALLLLSSFTTAAWHHTPGEVLAAWACVAALQATVEGGGPAPSQRGVAAATGAWAASHCALLGLLAAHNALPPTARLAARLAHDAGVASAALLLARK